MSTACGHCAPCVEQLSSEQDRRERLCAAIAVETEPLVTLTHLLRLCRDEHRVLWEHRLDPPCRDRVSTVLLLLADAAGPDPLHGELPAAVRTAMVEALQPAPGVPTVVVARTLVEFLDERSWTSFWSSFSRRSPYQPAVGDPVPIDNPDLRVVLDMQPTSPPWRLARRLDETRHARLAGAWATGFRVVFDYSRAEALTGIVTGGTTIAAISPNVDLAEFGLGQPPDRAQFPVAPEDEAAQRATILALVEQAAQQGATIVVLPELAVSAVLADELQDYVRRSSCVRLLVAGSQHLDAGDGSGRRNTAFAWLRGSDAPLLQDKHSPADSPVVEDLHYDGWPELRVHVSADGWHVALAVCRDLLNPGAVHALAEAGVNLLLAPAMSDTLLPFGASGAQLVGANQALIAMANGPADWARDERPVALAEPAMFGHPGLTGQTRLVRRFDASPGIALLDVRSALVRWSVATRLSADPGRSVAAADGETTPRWARHLARHLDGAPRGASPTALRRAAVLVLLSEGACGLQVLLTRRSAQLRHHPGEWVLPGGSAEAEDAGPVDTALREAREEVGIQPGQVTVLGALPALALDDGGWAVVPVVGWSATSVEPRPDAAEVAAWANVALSDLGGGDGGREGPLGTATTTVLDLLQAALARSGRRPARASA